MGDAFQRVNVDEQAARVLFLRQQEEEEDLADPIAAELAEWARMEAADTGEPSRSALSVLLSLDGVVAAATSGIIGGAAWSLFPAAARWVKERSAKKPATATEILTAVKSCLDAIEPGVSGTLAVSDMVHDHDGSWRLTLRSGERTYRIAVDEAGDLVALEMHAGTASADD